MAGGQEFDTDRYNIIVRDGPGCHNPQGRSIGDLHPLSSISPAPALGAHGPPAGYTEVPVTWRPEVNGLKHEINGTAEV
jgi:hypothetical protein